MRICFTLDDVLRAKTLQFGKMYKKYRNQTLDLDSIEFKTNDYYDIFEFENKKDYFKFLYDDFGYEIFGEAPVVERMIDKTFNLWHLNLVQNDEIEEKFEVIFANPFEFNASIGHTNFFLSKIAPKVREFYFPMNSLDIWDKCDVLVTAEPKLLNNKPEGKISIKIDMPYNTDCESDFSYEKLSEMLKDEEIIGNLLKKSNNE